MPHLLGKGSARFGVVSIISTGLARCVYVHSLLSWRQKCLWLELTQMVDRVVDSTTQLYYQPCRVKKTVDPSCCHMFRKCIYALMTCDGLFH